MTSIYQTTEKGMNAIYDKKETLNKMILDCKEFGYKNIARIRILPTIVNVDFE